MWIEQVNNLLTENQKQLLQARIIDFKVDERDGENLTGNIGKNYFTRSWIKGATEEFKSFEKGILEIIVQHESSFNIELNSIWINKITPDTNKKDPFHSDNSQIATVTFLNDDFVGGEFQYKLNGTQNIIPEKYKTIVFTGKQIKHRVRPVIKGERYTLVTFWERKKKTQNSLI
jgi:predicted Rdx family selenoprotein